MAAFLRFYAIVADVLYGFVMRQKRQKAPFKSLTVHDIFHWRGCPRLVNPELARIFNRILESWNRGKSGKKFASLRRHKIGGPRVHQVRINHDSRLREIHVSLTSGETRIPLRASIKAGNAPEVPGSKIRRGNGGSFLQRVRCKLKSARAGCPNGMPARPSQYGPLPASSL